MIAREFKNQIFAPSMGRKRPEEEDLDITYFPYLSWLEWMDKIKDFKYAVHLMPIFAAGTAMLNLSYCGIPTICYKNSDTARILHPNTSVEFGDLVSARKIAKRLKEDEIFWWKCSKETIELYKKHYSEDIYKMKMMVILDKIING
jgi:hypothetical protein